MSENLANHVERHNSPENLVPPNLEKQLQKERNENARNHENDNSALLEHARASAEAQYGNSETVVKGLEEEQHDTNEVRWWSRELKIQTLDRTLASVRTRLSRPERRFSKLIHQETVEKVSDFTGKTLVRPSGVLVGAIFAFIGSLISYLLAKRLGGQLPSSVSLVFFIGGFAIGIVGEFLFHIAHRFRQRRR